MRASLERLADLAAQADDRGRHRRRAFASERGDDTGADMLFWIAAVRRSIASHRRDIDQSPDAATALAARLASLEVDRADDGAGDGLRLSARP